MNRFQKWRKNSLVFIWNVNSNYGKGDAIGFEALFWFLFFLLFSRIRAEWRKNIYTKFNQTSFLSVRPTFSPSCTFNLTWPFRFERLIFFIIWCLLGSSNFSHSTTIFKRAFFFFRSYHLMEREGARARHVKKLCTFWLLHARSQWTRNLNFARLNFFRWKCFFDSYCWQWMFATQCNSLRLYAWTLSFK